MNKTTSLAQQGARYIFVSGFLGAGKTTAITKLSEALSAQGFQAGVIPNDEGSELVDADIFQSLGLPVEAVQGGGIGAQFESLMTAGARLIDKHRCNVIIVEPGGACADLVATALSPLRQRIGESGKVGPLSVVIDPIRAARLLGLEQGGAFSDKVAYVYRKQIEEAGILVVNKVDLVSPERVTRLKAKLSEMAPRAEIFAVSTRTGAGLKEWFDRLSGKEPGQDETFEIDYSRYNDGDALLGWLNCTVRISSVRYFDGNEVLRDLASVTQAFLRQDGVELAHLKMILKPDYDLANMAILSIARIDSEPEFSRQIDEPVQRAELVLNLRAETKPDVLHSAVNRALLEIMERSPELFARMEHCEHFQPNRIQPVHRLAKAATK